MNAEQKERAIQLITTWRTRSITTRPDESAVYGDYMTDILQELVDADDKFKTSVLAAINAAAPNARHVEVDGQPVFFSRSGDDITDTHTLTPCPHCGGSGAAEDCAPEPEPFGYFKSEPFGWTDCAETDDGAIALYTAPPAPSVQDGWRLVPETATVEMRNAGMAHLTGLTSYANSMALKVYGAMLAAAPPPPRLSDERIREIWIEHGLDDEDVEGFARAIEREILGGQVE